MKKHDSEDKDIIVTRLMDEFFERKKAGEGLTIDEYVKNHPEYADELRNEIEEELSWVARFAELKETPLIVSTEEELNRGWERIRTMIAWEKIRDQIWRLVQNIEVHISKSIQQTIVVPDLLALTISHQIIPIPPLLGDGESQGIDELEITIPAIRGSLNISFYPPDTQQIIEIKIQPKIKGTKKIKQHIPVILKDRLKDMMLERSPVHPGKFAQFKIRADGEYSICIEWQGKIFEVPLTFILEK